MTRNIKAISIFLLALVLSGCASGTKNVTDMKYTLKQEFWNDSRSELVYLEREGLYTGPIVDGVPEGDGFFTAQNAEGATWSYSGNFSAGVFSGYGRCEWENGLYEEGTYTNGHFAPTTAELLRTIGQYVTAPYTISDNNFAFINEHQDLFSGETESDAFINHNLTYAMLTKSIANGEGQLYTCSLGGAIQVWELPIFGHTITTIVACDLDANMYMLIHNGALPDIYDRSEISFTGLPVSNSSFENISGGTTNVVVVLTTNINEINK